MPVLMLLDVSLSVLAPMDFSTSTAGENSNSKRNIALIGATAFVDYLSQYGRQEFLSIASFSEDMDVTEFTKDYSSLNGLLSNSGAYETRTRTNIVDALRGSFYRCVSVWGSNVLCHVIVVTDCAGYNPEFERLVNSLAILERKQPVEPPADWPSSNSDELKSSNSDLNSAFAMEFHRLIRRGLFTFHVVCINNIASNDFVFQHNIKLYKKLIDFFEHGSSFRCIEEPASKSVVAIFQQMADELSAASSATLRCGSLFSLVNIYPALIPIKKDNDFDVITSKLSDSITIIGFLRPSELGSPPVTSRHLLLSVKSNGNVENLDPGQQKVLVHDRAPNFCVLLHGAMKMEDAVAICEIGPNWYGYIYHLPSGKRSNLILYCFEPGIDAVPWLGSLNKLGLRPYLGPSAPVTSTKSPFPINFKTKPSYALTTPNWIHNYGIQADIQKLLRYAKKLPEKEQQFYQELNRICNAALTLGFTELLLSLAGIFEKEVLNFGVKSPQGIVLSKVINALVSDRLKYGDSISLFLK